MARAVSVWPGGAGAQVQASPAVCLRFPFWRGTLLLPGKNQSQSQCAGSTVHRVLPSGPK